MLFQRDSCSSVTFQKVRRYSDSTFIALGVRGAALMWSSVLKQAWEMKDDITHQAKAQEKGLGICLFVCCCPNYFHALSVAA